MTLLDTFNFDTLDGIARIIGLIGFYSLAGWVISAWPSNTYGGGE